MKITPVRRFFTCIGAIQSFSVIAQTQRIAQSIMKKGPLSMSQNFEWADEIKHLSEEQIEQLYQRYLNG